MSEQLRRVHALLRAGNVPCSLSSTSGARDGRGTILLAGTPNPGPWEVQLQESAGRLVLINEREAVQIPPGAGDAAIADAVKLRVVQAWAEQGDPQAIAVLRALTGVSGPGPRSGPRPSATRDHRGRPGDFGVRTVTIEFVDPMQIAGDLFAAAARIGWDLVKGRVPGYAAAFTLFNPWLTYQRESIRR